ncbi:MAG TPA: hypothetical protein VHD91_03755 [Gaiellaceae bacterium]|nr:hypothetical protein [Gaiellaceae bacterium]
MPCTRAWMTAGCASFLPLVHSTFGASLSLAPKQSKVRGALTCDYDRGATVDAFGFAFVPKGVTAAIFQSLFADAAQGWTACQAGADASTQTPLALPTLVPGLGTQAYEYDPCPGSAVVSDPSEPTTPDFAVGLVRVGATDYSGGGAGITLTQLNAFWRRLIVKYP